MGIAAAQSSSLVARIQGILLRPKQEWPVIAGETTTVADLYKRYIVPLAAIGPVANFIGAVVFGINIPFFGTIRPELSAALAQAVVTYVLALIGVYVLALVIDALAPTFGGTKDSIQALKVAAYGSTASWVAGVFAIFPALGFLGILGVYSLYLLYLGLPVLMKSPPDRSLTYTGAVIVVAFVVFIVIGAVSSAFVPTAF